MFTAIAIKNRTNVVHKAPLNTDESEITTPILLKIELGLHFIMNNSFRWVNVILKVNQQTNDKRHIETTENIIFARIEGSSVDQSI